MATCNLKLYNTELTPIRNALVDDLEIYLQTLTPTYTDGSFQYLKLDSDIDINIDCIQILRENLGNYARIEQDGRIWYYFILETKWKSTQTIQLKLSIDSINTFRDQLTWSDKTAIIREHRDRFYPQQTGSSYLIRKIDKEPENIVGDKRMSLSNKINEAGLNYNWYLMYRTRNSLSVTDIGNPIDCFLFADTGLKISDQGAASKTYVYTDFTAGYYYYLNDIDNPGAKFGGYTLGNTYSQVVDINYTNNVPSYVTANRTLRGLILYVTGQELYCAYQWNDYVAYWDTSASQSTVRIGLVSPTAPNASVPSISSLSGTPLKQTSSYTVTKSKLFRYSTTYYNTPELVYLNVTNKMNAYIGYGAEYTNTINDIDKTDSRILKIIKLPYCPVEVTTGGGIFTFPAEWTYTDGLMKLDDTQLSTEFSNKIGTVQIPELFHILGTASRTEPKKLARESKLWHSDFYNFKLVYDSFVRDLKLENMDLSSFQAGTVWTPSNTEMEITFKPTNTINSKFAFYLNFDKASNFATYDQDMDYEKYLLVDRNNEETIFSNDYIDYIRNGYNYDKKAKAQQATQNMFMGGLQLAAGIGSMAASAVTGGVSAAAGIALLTSAVSTLSSNAYSQTQNENNMNQKLANLAAQSTAVAGADDIDLLTFYNGNRLNLIKYMCKDYQRQALWKLFFYCGYSHKINDVPDFDSRFWFNFVQCKPVFNGINNIANNYLDDIRSRYEAGVTVYHDHDGIWDWSQEYENWETFVTDDLATPAFTDKMMINLSFQNDQKASLKYIGDETLNGVTTYVSFEIVDSNFTLVQRTSSLDSTTHKFDTVNATFDYPVSHVPGYLLRARLMNGSDMSKTSDWIYLQIS